MSLWREQELQLKIVGGGVSINCRRTESDEEPGVGTSWWLAPALLSNIKFSVGAKCNDA